jgi:hypothetical protein
LGAQSLIFPIKVNKKNAASAKERTIKAGFQILTVGLLIGLARFTAVSESSMMEAGCAVAMIAFL